MQFSDPEFILDFGQGRKIAFSFKNQKKTLIFWLKASKPSKPSKASSKILLLK